MKLTSASRSGRGRSRGVFAAAVALRIFSTGEAYAQEAAPAISTNRVLPNAPLPPSWYGYQTLVVDGFAALFATLGTYATIRVARGDGSASAAAGGISLVLVATTGYLLGPPTIHWAHGRVAAGFESLGLRVLAPLAGLGAGALAAEIANGSTNQTAIPVGGLLGMVAASALDAALLGWEPGPGSAPPETGARIGVAFVSRGATLGIGGAF